jgi:hypothetical protein
MAQNHSLHMKRDERNLKNEKYFDFLKMDKKNVQIWDIEILLTDEIFCLDTKKLWCHFKPKIKNFKA